SQAFPEPMAAWDQSSKSYRNRPLSRASWPTLPRTWLRGSVIPEATHPGRRCPIFLSPKKNPATWPSTCTVRRTRGVDLEPRCNLRLPALLDPGLQPFFLMFKRSLRSHSYPRAPRQHEGDDIAKTFSR